MVRAAGPSYGYYPNPSKMLLMVKSEILEPAEEMFKSTGINLTDSGKRYLGAMLGKRPAVGRFCKGENYSMGEEG